MSVVMRTKHRIMRLVGPLLLAPVAVIASGDIADADTATEPSKPFVYASTYAPNGNNNVAYPGDGWVSLVIGSASDGGSPITSYTITGGGFSWQVVPGVSPQLQDDSAFRIGPLPDGAYSFRAYATNAVGNSSLSDPTPSLTAADNLYPWGTGFPPTVDSTMINPATVVPSDGAVLSLNQQVPIYFSPFDPSNLFISVAFNDDVPVAFSEYDPFDSPHYLVNTSTEGTHHLTFVTLDGFQVFRTKTLSYCVVACSSGGGDLPPTDAGPGETVTTDPTGQGATPEVPVQTAVTLPEGSGGTVAIDLGDITQSPPTGYSFLGNQITVDTDATGTVAAPLILSFTIEGSTPGLDVSTLGIVRTESGNSVSLPLCTGTVGTAIPDPCMTAPTQITSGPATGDIQVTVYTTHASDWNFAVHAPFTVSGLFQPVDNRPTLNSMAAGAAVPVKFSLGGDKGLGVFARGYPTSGSITCGTDPTIDPIEQTVTANVSGLTYTSNTGSYTYTWKTEKAWRGSCRQLVLKFTDGSTVRANFKFK